ncbi:hypothetical protein KDQ40_16325 (plasmid) [Haloarcula marismortui ATCC 33800]|nr:hypothetical protein KDQ40_16325 [Haloarcula sinaiiensis ATCC 33800]
MNIESAVSELTSAKSQMDGDPPDSIPDKKDVLNEYQPLFQPNEVANLPEDRLKEFLRYENNRHWTGLHRQEHRLTEDMDELRGALETLVDEGEDLANRVTDVKDTVDGMGKATLSAILLTAYPEKYGVWNNRSEEALKQLDVWPEFETGAEFGERYAEVNTVLRDLSDELEIDHWTLDALLGYVVENDLVLEEPTIEDAPQKSEFVKEKHLQQYLVNNWDHIQLSQDWQIYSDSDDPEAGVEFSTGVGRPDILLTHKTDSRVCVVELKKSNSSDRAVGQLLRYVGWIDEHLDDLENVAEDADIEGRLIVSGSTEKLDYALSAVQDLTLHEYDVNVELRTSPVLG